MMVVRCCYKGKDPWWISTKKSGNGELTWVLAVRDVVFVDDLFKVFVLWSLQMVQHYFDVMM